MHELILGKQVLYGLSSIVFPVLQIFFLDFASCEEGQKRGLALQVLRHPSRNKRTHLVHVINLQQIISLDQS